MTRSVYAAEGAIHGGQEGHRALVRWEKSLQSILLGRSPEAEPKPKRDKAH